MRRFVPIFRRFCTHVSRKGRGMKLRCISRNRHNSLLRIVRESESGSHIVNCSLRNVRGSRLRVALNNFPVGHRNSRKRGGAFLVTLGLTRFSFLEEANDHATPLLLLSSVFSGLSTTEIRRVMGLITKRRFNRVFVASAGHSRLSNVLGSVRRSCGLFRMRKKRVES